MLKLTAIDLSRLRWSLLLAITLVVAGVTMFRYSSFALQKAAMEAQDARAERSAAMAKRLHAQDEATAIRDNVATYLELQSRGVLGQERRLEWVERINAIRLARRLPEFQYELSPQQSLAPPAGTATSTGTGGANTPAAALVLVSPMKAQLGLLHEQDLLDTVSDLQTNVPAFVRTRHCVLSRTSGTPSATPSNALLHATCEFDWITLREPA
jgi:hypothetical protein